jgi:hypothetical protein
VSDQLSKLKPRHPGAFDSANVPGKSRVFILARRRVLGLWGKCEAVAANGYEGFTLAQSGG